MSKRRSNKSIKRMICSIHEQSGEEVCFESLNGYGEGALIGWSLCCGDGFSEWVDYPIKYGMPISLAASKLKGE